MSMRYNEEHGITPTQITKEIKSALPTNNSSEETAMPDNTNISKAYQAYLEPDSAAFAADPIIVRMTRQELEKSIANTTELMKQAAKNLDFVQAAQYRDEIIRLQKELELK